MKYKNTVDKNNYFNLLFNQLEDYDKEYIINLLEHIIEINQKDSCNTLFSKTENIYKACKTDQTKPK